MEKRDLKQIREEMAQVIEDNINPQFEGIRTQFEEVGTRIGNLEKGLNQVRLEMVTKSYLDDKLADLEGGLIAKLKKEDIKMNRLIEIMNDGGAPFEAWANAGLNAGHHAGCIAGSDDHTCKPGRTVATGVWARELTRQGIWDALCQRRCIAGMGRRPVVTFRINDSLMGACAAAPARRRFEVSHAHQDEPLTVILVRNGSAVAESRRPGAEFSVVLEDTAALSGMLEDY